MPSEASGLVRILDHLVEAYRAAKDSGEEHVAHLIAVALVEVIALEIAAVPPAGTTPPSDEE